MLFGIEDVLNFSSMIGLIEYHKRQGLCQGTCHFDWIYMALKYHIKTKIEFIWKDSKIFLRKMFDHELGNELFSSSSSFPNSQNNKLSLSINIFKNTKLQ